MRRPRALRPGDQIRVVSPASPLSPDQVKEGVWWLEQLGFRVTFGLHAFDHTGYLAGNDVDRAADLTAAFLDPDVAAVACSRGGYGSVRLLDHLDLDVLASNPKLFWGFSDITTLHIALNRRGLPTLHAPMPITLGSPREPWVYDSLAGQLRGVVATPPAAPRGKTLTGGLAEGIVTGGCLSLLCDSIATSEPIEPEGKILLIEDVDEYPHRVDALFTHLRRTGKSNPVRANRVNNAGNAITVGKRDSVLCRALEQCRFYFASPGNGANAGEWKRKLACGGRPSQCLLAQTDGSTDQPRAIVQQDNPCAVGYRRTLRCAFDLKYVFPAKCEGFASSGINHYARGRDRLNSTAGLREIAPRDRPQILRKGRARPQRAAQQKEKKLKTPAVHSS